MAETVAIVNKRIASKKQIHHVAVNAGKIVAMQSDLQFCKSVN